MAREVSPEVLGYMEQQKSLTLATTGVDGPWAATLTYVNDGPRVYFWIRPNSRTARHIEQNPRVAFAIDEYAEDWRQTRGIQGRGACEAVTGEEIARVGALFGYKYPDLRPGSTSAVVFYGVEPTVLEFIDNTSGVEEGGGFGAEYRRSSALHLPAIDD